MQLVAKCYVLVNDANANLIADIKGGIKKEVSVGFRLGSYTCSVCGTDNVKAWCEHWPGKEYDGHQCHFAMSDIRDAYELSFVAVPAQREAGAVKLFGDVKPDVKRRTRPEGGRGKASEARPRRIGGGEDTAREKEIETRLRLTGAFLF